MANEFWTSQVPLYVTRKTASGQIGAFYITGWIFMMIGLFAVLNLALWGGYGIYEWFKVVI